MYGGHSVLIWPGCVLDHCPEETAVLIWPARPFGYRRSLPWFCLLFGVRTLRYSYGLAGRMSTEGSSYLNRSSWITQGESFGAHPAWQAR